MGIMHDAIHGSYSKKKAVNRCLGLTMNLIGANADVWRIQHNVLHHTYTNVQEADDDINMPFFLRFSSHGKKYWIHRFQYLYRKKYILSELFFRKASTKDKQGVPNSGFNRP
ncbi:fatty acid desaturase [Pricia sp.]|uniref:fatty acid desaturase n=1 Tax=Pricia sp. TaxID=2268138 RepID=UPI003593D86F